MPLVTLSAALAATPYEQPAPAVTAILDAQRPPSVSLSPDRAWLLLSDRPSSPPITEIAAPVVKVAGLRVDPDTNGPARENPSTAVSLRRLDRPNDAPTTVLSARIRSSRFDHDGRRLALEVVTDAGVELWLADVGPKPGARRVVGPRLNAAVTSPCAWLPGDQGLLCLVVPEGRGAAPVAPTTPLGPRVEESLGRRSPARTYADLLATPTDEALLTHYATSELVRVALDGTVTPALDAAAWTSFAPSPDGRYVLASAVTPPWSRRVPIGLFARRTVAVELATGTSTTVAELAVADEVSTRYDSVRPGRRRIEWRDDEPSTLAIVEAMDGGDAEAKAVLRDRVSTLPAPFTGVPATLFESEQRVVSLTWGDAHLALVREGWYATKRTRTWRVDPAGGAAPALVWDRSSQDEYGDPGDALLEPGPYGAWVLRRTRTGGLLLRGAGVSADGVHPFLDRLEWSAAGAPTITRLWRSEDPLHETMFDVLDDDGKVFLTWRESQVEVPNLWLHRGKKSAPVTAFPDWAPAFASVRKEVVTYTRADGLPLSATVYYPPGYDPSGGPRPALFWVYPNEFERRSDAGQVTATSDRFSRPAGPSHLFHLLEGWVVVDNPQLPIVADGDTKANDTYVEQLVAGAQAAVDALAAKGTIDRTRVVVGGHSYGAFTTANLLAHTDLFRAGIARSGAYNRTLTPFSFQGEERTYWEAHDTYDAMSPFTVADQIDEPLLLVHGADDANPGTWPVQSQRMFDALKGLGATVRWVELPAEEHGYRARESAGHVLWEMDRWTDTYAPAQ